MHLRIFGLLAYLHIDVICRDKLDAKSKSCIFVGYGEDELGFLLRDETTKIVV